MLCQGKHLGSMTQAHVYNLTTLEANFWRNCQSIKLGLAEEECKPQGLTILRQQDEGS